jgi:hypothetical protein
MKQFYVHLTYMSMKSTQRVTIEAENADCARIIALQRYPQAEINGPAAVAEVTTTGNCITTLTS